MAYPLMILNPLAIITSVFILFPGKDGFTGVIAVTVAISNLIPDVIIVYAQLDQGERNYVNLRKVKSEELTKISSRSIRIQFVSFNENSSKCNWKILLFLKVT